MSDIELNKVKTDATSDLAHIKSTLASDELKAKTTMESVWSKYEIYIVGALCLGMGFMVGHLVR